MIKQILFAVTGMSSAFIPAHDESALPFDLLVQAFNTFYGMHNLPVIMQPNQSENMGETKYLSISQNSVTMYDTKTYRPLLYLNEIKQYLPLYLEHLKNHLMTRDNIYGQMHGRLNLKFYSEKGVAAEEILRASDLQYDSRIVEAYKNYRIKPDQTFPERAPFLKAFVGFTFN